MADIEPRFDFAALAGGPEPMVLLLLVLLADAVLGNPAILRRWLPHPALLLAVTASGLERRLNRGGRSPVKRLVRGVLALVLVLALALGASWLVLLASAVLPFGWLIEFLFLASLIAQRGPLDEARLLLRALEGGGLEAGRQAAAEIAGPAAQNMDQPALVRAAVSHLAERLLDGLVAALFWLILLGLPGLAAYRAINIAGRLWDDRNPERRDFGLAASRLDDVVGYLPGRLAGLLVVLAAVFVPSTSPGAALRVMGRDALRHRSLSLAWVVAAMAGALGLALTEARVARGPQGRAAPAAERQGAAPSIWLGQHEGRALAGTADIMRAIYLYAVAALISFALVTMVAMVQLSL
ncbi:MAG: cobalamin biosynthesis protein [Alphaproteobacteria bacterium]|jgi:adenosylcobinamide-phosphate synthase|nr:cobalamin biosynthesis protein [Alphaproteobacteria bacterium]